MVCVEFVQSINKISITQKDTNFITLVIFISNTEKLEKNKSN